MSNCIEIINEEKRFPLDVKVKFNFAYKEQLKSSIKNLETIKDPMNCIFDLIYILKSKLE